MRDSYRGTLPGNPPGNLPNILICNLLELRVYVLGMIHVAIRLELRTPLLPKTTQKECMFENLTP